MHPIVPYDPPAVVYVATFPNGKQYVGMTSDFAGRLRSHKSKARLAGNLAFHNAIRKHGWPLWSIAWAGVFSLAPEAERKFIRELDTLAPNGYNLTLGGEGVLGLVMSESGRKKISERLSGIKRSEGFKARISTAVRQRFANPEERERARERSSAMWRDADNDKRKTMMSGLAMGRTEDANRKKSESVRKSWLNPQRRLRQQQAAKKQFENHAEGYAAWKESVRKANNRPEVRARHSANAKARWAKPEFRAKMMKIMQSVEHRQKLSESQPRRKSRKPGAGQGSLF